MSTKRPAGPDLVGVAALLTCAVGTAEVLFGGGLGELAGVPTLRAAGTTSGVLALHLLAGAAVGLIAVAAGRIRPGTRVAPAALVLSWVVLLPLLPVLREETRTLSLPLRALVSLATVLVVFGAGFLALRAVLPAPRARSGRWPSRIAVALLTVTVAVWVAARSAPGPDTASVATAPNVILVSLDTVRADHLQPYGYPRPTSPTLQRLAGEAVVFDEAFAPEPWTLPSHMTMMTGLLPLRHGVRKRQSRLSEEITTLAEALGSRGYRAYSFVASGPTSWVGGLRGFADGFDRYHHPPHWRTWTLGSSLLETAFAPFAPAAGSAEDIAASAVRFLRRSSREPFFLFLHFFDAHSDGGAVAYEASEESIEAVAGEHDRHFEGCLDGLCGNRLLARAGDCGRPGARAALEPWMIDDVVAHYDAGIRRVDRALSRVLGALDEAGLTDRSLIVVTADHGEEFLDHGSFLHTQIHREVTRVPLLIRLPGGGSARRLGDRVSLADLLPTILEVAGVEAPAGIDGTSLLAPIRGESGERRPLMFSNTRQAGEFDLRDVGIRLGDYLLIRRFAPRCDEGPLGDPVEVWDEHAGKRDDAAAARGELDAALEEWWRSTVLPDAASDDVDVSPEEMERLRSLGYLGG